LNGGEWDVAGNARAKASVESLEDALCPVNLPNGLLRVFVLSQLHVLLDDLERAANQQLADFGKAARNNVLRVDVGERTVLSQ